MSEPTLAELEAINQARLRAEAEFEADIEQCVATERRVRQQVGTPPKPSGNFGKRTLGCKTSYNSQRPIGRVTNTPLGRRSKSWEPEAGRVRRVDAPPLKLAQV